MTSFARNPFVVLLPATNCYFVSAQMLYKKHNALVQASFIVTEMG